MLRNLSKLLPLLFLLNQAWLPKLTEHKKLLKSRLKRLSQKELLLRRRRKLRKNPFLKSKLRLPNMK
jgi:hypothetical protein